MARLVEACRTMWLPGLSSLDGEPASTMHDWLTKANFAPAVSGGSIELQGLDMQLLLRAFAGDVNRVASAGSESLRNIANIVAIPKSLGWPYVKLYYSSLFYAHVLLRVWGRSPSYLKTSDLMRVKQSFALYNIIPPFKIQTGQYLISANPMSSSLSIISDKGGGGSHEAIWREFQVGLAELRARIILAPFTSSDKNKLDKSLSLAIELLTNQGSNAAWLSTMRNDIQYRQSEGLWFPYTGRKKTADLVAHSTTILNDASNAESMLAAAADGLSRFNAACSFVIVLARQTLLDISQVGGAKNFLKFGQAKFERSITFNS